MSTTLLALQPEDMLTKSAKLLGLFEMWDMCKLGHFLGYQVTYDHKHKMITIAQDSYTRMIVKCAGLGHSNPTKLLIAAGTQLQCHEGTHLDFPYSCHISSVLYAALATCPDIAYAVQHLLQLSLNPGPTHVASVKAIFTYLKGTTTLRITYNGHDKPTHPIGYSDTNWAQNIIDWISMTSKYLSLVVLPFP
jgi:hypothetical protein